MEALISFTPCSRFRGLYALKYLPFTTMLVPLLSCKSMCTVSPGSFCGVCLETQTLNCWITGQECYIETILCCTSDKCARCSINFPKSKHNERSIEQES